MKKKLLALALTAAMCASLAACGGSSSGEATSAAGGDAAALAAHRFVLRCLARGATVAIGDPKSGPAGARDAARALEEDYRRTAAPWLRPAGFCFRRAGGPGVGP